MKKKTYKLLEAVNNTIIKTFPYLTAEEHAEIMENFIYDSLLKKFKKSNQDDSNVKDTDNEIPEVKRPDYETKANTDHRPPTEAIALIASLASIPLASAAVLYKKYGEDIINKLTKETEPSMMEKAKARFKNLMKKIRLAESAYKKSKKLKRGK